MNSLGRIEKLMKNEKHEKRNEIHRLIEKKYFFNVRNIDSNQIESSSLFLRTE